MRRPTKPPWWRCANSSARALPRPMPHRCASWPRCCACRPCCPLSCKATSRPARRRWPAWATKTCRSRCPRTSTPRSTTPSSTMPRGSWRCWARRCARWPTAVSTAPPCRRRAAWPTRSRAAGTSSASAASAGWPTASRTCSTTRSTGPTKSPPRWRAISSRPRPAWTRWSMRCAARNPRPRTRWTGCAASASGCTPLPRARWNRWRPRRCWRRWTGPYPWRRRCASAPRPAYTPTPSRPCASAWIGSTTCCAAPARASRITAASRSTCG